MVIVMIRLCNLWMWCWTLVGQSLPKLSNWQGTPPYQHTFKNSNSSVKHILQIKSLLKFIDGELIGRIGRARDANEKYETIEKIGKGAYGNVKIYRYSTMYIILIGILGEGSWYRAVLCHEDNFQGPYLPSA